MAYQIQTSPAIERYKAAVANLPGSKRFSDSDLEAVYTHAYNVYQQRHFDQALTMFGFLTQYRPASAKFRKGLAATQKMLGLYADAEQSYSFLLLLDPNDPEPAISCAECLIRLGNLKDAGVTLKGAVALARNAGRNDLVEKADALAAALEKSTH